MSGDLFHAASIEVAVPAEAAFTYLSDGLKQGDWTLGSWNRERAGDGLFRGTSLFSGADTFVRITAHPEQLLVDYEVGPAPDRLLRVNSARIVPGPVVGRPEGTCLIALTKWRGPAEDDVGWQRGCSTFDTEIHMIKGRLELGF
jgi:hypothetical protein